MTKRGPTKWTSYPECERCGAPSGSACTGFNDRRLTRPHPERKAAGYLPNPGGRG